MISGVTAFSAVKGPPGTKRIMKKVAVMMTQTTGTVWRRRWRTNRIMGRARPSGGDPCGSGAGAPVFRSVRSQVAHGCGSAGRRQRGAPAIIASRRALNSQPAFHCGQASARATARPIWKSTSRVLRRAAQVPPRLYHVRHLVVVGAHVLVAPHAAVVGRLADDVESRRSCRTRGRRPSRTRSGRSGRSGPSRCRSRGPARARPRAGRRPPRRPAWSCRSRRPRCRATGPRSCMPSMLMSARVFVSG